jgi:hypothetical protein
MTAITIQRAAASLAVRTAAAIPIATASGASTRSGSELIVLTSKGQDGNDGTVAARAKGLISGLGTAHIGSSRNGRVDHVKLHLPRGTLLLTVRLKSFTFQFDPKACTATNNGRGAFTITGGTKAFHGARGHGTYRRHTAILGTRTASGTCLGQSAPPKAVSNNLKMTGTASLPST